MNTVIYLIRHADTINEKGIRNTDETSQIINEKEILSIKGEETSKKLSKNIELKNIDAIWSSSYTRAKQTTKYIASENNLPINLDYRLNERKLGNLNEIATFMSDKKTRDPSQEQLVYTKFKTSDGESAEDTNKRMTEFLNEILEKYKEKRVAIVSHGGSIKFLLLNWCEVNKNMKLEYKGKELNITSPCLLKLTFDNKQLVNLEQKYIIEHNKENYEHIKIQSYIGETITAKIDRQMGAKHPKYDFIYPINYGYIPNTISGDGEELDCYILGVFEPIESFTGKCIAIIHRLNDNDDKLVLVPKDKKYTNDEIRVLTEFQERFFDSIIIN